MKLIPNGSRKATPDKHYGGRPRVPAWQKEWLANKALFVLLKCGCTEDLNPRLTPLVRSMLNGDIDVWCDKHEGFYTVVGKSLGRDLGIKVARVPDEPMF